MRNGKQLRRLHPLREDCVARPLDVSLFRTVVLGMFQQRKRLNFLFARIAPHGVAKTQNLVYNVRIMVTLKRIFADEQMYTWAMEQLRQSFPPEERRDDQL